MSTVGSGAFKNETIINIHIPPNIPIHANPTINTKITIRRARMNQLGNTSNKMT